MPRPLSLILKTTSACNMACRYCDADIYSRERMSFEVLAHVTHKALRTDGDVSFIWHGGEPLLLGKEFYRKAVWLQHHYKRSNQRVLNTIQTNGTLLDDEWLDLFDEAAFSIGLSLDGPALLHDSNRVLANKRGTFEKVMRAVSLMRQRKRGFGVLAVVSEETMQFGAREFFRFFVDNDLKHFALLCQRPALNVSRTEYVQRRSGSAFLREIFDLWLAENDPEISIRDFDSIIKSLLGGRHTTCLLAGGCIGRYFAVDPRGAVFHCDEFMFDPAYRLGNIVTDDFGMLRSSETIRLLEGGNANQIRDLDCPWLPVCNGGCPKDRYVAYKLNGDVRCCGFANLIKHIQSRIAANVPAYGVFGVAEPSWPVRSESISGLRQIEVTPNADAP